MTDEAPELRDEPAPEGETPETRPRGPSPDSIGIDPIAAGRGTRLADRLDRPLFRLLDPPPDAMAPGDRLGPYRILRPLGRGGSGCVYLAEQCAGGLRRRVAVKVLSPGVNAREVLERFRTEGRILARLRHAHIATLYDAGITPAGRPYFALEWVEGSPIDRYCRERALPLRDRLAIFLQVCSAVRYAHQNLVIHRDLKPGNILVDGRGEPRLLDFGIAKLLGGERAGGPGTTHPWVRPMTPEYASPEQILGEPVTTVSDVYCLGVLLFELLAGEHPHAAVERSPYALQRRICEEDPERPSAVAGRRHRAGSEGARSRGPGARRARQLRGELDAIVLTAMARRPEDRYGSVSELADDVRRYLEGYPVRARRPGAIVRGVKLLRRHLREAVAAALVLLTVGGALLLRAHERARRFEEREHTVRVAELLFDLLETADLQTARDRPVTVRALLDEAAERLETELPHDPRLRATMHELLGRSFRNLGAYGRAAPFLEAAYAERSARLGPDHPETVEALSELASLEVRRGRFARAESLYRRALQHRAARFGDDDSGTVGLREALAMVLVDQDRFAEAEPLLRRVLTARTGGGPASQPARLAATRSNLAFLLHRTGEHAEAIPLLRAALTTSRRSLGDDHPQVSALRINLAAALRARGRLGEAERLIRSTLAVWERELGP
ncbi:MAG: serine/threonine-protein kinase, partial [Acidobacteriota bacterium]